MNKEKEIHQSIRRKEREEILKQEFEVTLYDRITRYLQVNQAKIIPYHYFAEASRECIFIFQDGHFYGCISLTQAVAEAIVKLLCKKNGWKPTDNFEKNVSVLHNREFISKKLKDNFSKIWRDRNNYLHLNNKVQVDDQKLAELAKAKICLLAEIEKEIFDFTISNAGSIKPKYPKYWETEHKVYLRFE